MNKTVILGIIVAIVLLLGGVFVLQGRQGEEPEIELQKTSPQFIVGQQAPDFTLKDFDGENVQLSDFYGKKAVVLDFWAAWCPFCIEEMSLLQNVHEEYGDEVVMIGVHRTDSGESIETGKKFADEQGVKYLLVQGTNEVYRASTKGINAMPTAVFIDKNGVVSDIKLGPKTESEIAEKVEQLLK